MDDQTVIATSAGITFASVAASKISDGEIPSGRFVAATCLAFAGLGLIAMAAPDIGKGLAISVAGTAFIVTGLPLLITLFPDNPQLTSLGNKTANALNRTAKKGTK